MRILYSWLRDFVDVPDDPAAVAAALASRGLEVASVEPHSPVPGPAGRRTSGPDAVIDFDISANRPDCLSVIGLAREAAAIYQQPLRELGSGAALSVCAVEAGLSVAVKVTVDDSSLCPRYSAAVADVTVGPSPSWLAERLDAAGIRPINNIVDVTNYLLMEIGQPMHAFDLARLAGGEIRVRRAKPGETLRTLDGQERMLAPDILVIADGAVPQALAGVMGGAASEVSASTKTIVLESACFEPRSVRSTSKKLALKTEASARFERGTDIETPVVGLARACALLEQMGAGSVRGPVVDVYPAPAPRRRLTVRRDRAAMLIGTSVPDGEIERILRALGFGVAPVDGGWTVHVPTWRVDVAREADLIEEIARHWGYDRIEPTFPPVRNPAPAPDVRVTRDQLIRRVLTAAGFSEAISFGFIEVRALEPFAPGSESADVVTIGNPLSAKFSVLRRTLLPGLVDAVAHNRRHGLADVQLFEIGTRFSRHDGESRGVALAWTGAACDRHWSGSHREVDFFDVKGAVERISDALRLPIRFETATRGYLAQGQTAAIVLTDPAAGISTIGEVGQLAPAVAEARGLARAEKVYVAELNLDALWYEHAARTLAEDAAVRAGGRPSDAFTPLPRFPWIARDISILVDERLPAETVRGTIAAAAPAWLTGIREFDRYHGKGVPDGRVSLSLRLTFRSDERTLTDAEVQQAMDEILGALTREHGAVQR
jgi:phenylalanyl-tRNA synthetase beta chain